MDDNSMQCRDVRELADSFVDGELSVELNQAILRHLESCPACQADIEARRALRERVRSAFLAADTLAPRREWVDQLRDRLRTPAAPQPTKTFRAWQSGGLALAATLLLAASVVVVFGPAWRGASALVELARTAAGDHRNCAITFALAERPIPLAEAAARYDPAYRALEQTPADVVPARGGAIEVLERHSCVYAGRRFAHVVVRYQGEVVSMLVTAEPDGFLSRLLRPSGGELAGTVTSVGPDAVAYQRVGGHVVFVVGDAGRQLVRDVADAVSPAVYKALSGA